MKNKLRIAHISDLHFGVLSGNPLQFFSKRCLGNMNLLFARKKKWAKTHIDALSALLEQQNIDLVIFTGDATCTSRHAEFKLAANFFKELKDKEIETVALPGNHDHYTRKAYRARHFYDHLPFTSPIDTPFCHYNLRSHSVGVKKLLPNWWLIALDTALATSWVSSRGLFSKEIEQCLLRILSEIPKGDNILIANHFPFFQHETPRKILLRGDQLQKILSDHPQVKLYIHGHTHRRCIADLRENNLPIIIDCGSTGMGPLVSWNQIDLRPSSIHIQHYESAPGIWKEGATHTFKL